MKSQVFRSIRLAASVLAMTALPALAAAQASSANASPMSLAGTWNMSLIGDHVIPVALLIEQKGTALTGTFILMGKDYPLAGEVKGDSFELRGQGPGLGRGNDHGAAAAAAAPQPATPPPANGPRQVTINLADLVISGKSDGNGGLLGEMGSKPSEGKAFAGMKWTAERLKERKLPTSQGASTDGVNVTGKWATTINEAQVHMEMDLTHAGSKVTGTATSDHLGVMKVEGALANGTLTLVATGSVGGQDVRLELSGKYKADGSFAGDLTSQMGAMTWTAARVKK